MTDNERIAALQAKAEGMGYEFLHNTNVNYVRINAQPDSLDRNLMFMLTVDSGDKGLDTAATLLGALDPDAVGVVIGWDGLQCGKDCLFSRYGTTGACGTGHRCILDLSVRGGWDGGDGSYMNHGHLCPGPAKPGKKWIIVEVPE